MRCVATQKIGPPSSASVPQMVRKYSIHFGRLVAAVRQQAVIAHADAERAGDPPQDDAAMAMAPQSMKKNAATARMWNAVMAMAVIQLISPSEALRP